MYQAVSSYIPSLHSEVRDSWYRSIDQEAGTDNSQVFPSIPQTFFSEAKKMKMKREGFRDFCISLCVLLSSVLWCLAWTFYIALSIALIVIGAKHLDDCPVQKLVPIGLIVVGCVELTSIAMNTIHKFSYCATPRSQTVLSWINGFVIAFVLAWLVAIGHLGYNLQPAAESGHSNYCNQIFYSFFSRYMEFTFACIILLVIYSFICMRCKIKD